MQHIWKVLLTSLLIFALAATACLAEDSEAQYQAYSYTTFSLRRTPSESDRGISVQKKTKILILEWDDAWCKVQVGNKVGYAKPEWLYRVQSLDALHYPLQNLPHRMSGYVEFSQDTLISGGKFKGCTASAGQIACVEAQADGAYLLPVWRGEMQLTDEIGTYLSLIIFIIAYLFSACKRGCTRFFVFCEFLPVLFLYFAGSRCYTISR